MINWKSAIRENWVSALLSIGPGILIFVILQTLRVPLNIYASKPSLFFGVFADTAWAVFRLLWPALLATVFLSGVHFLAEKHDERFEKKRNLLLLCFGISLVVTGWTYSILIDYSPFKGHIPFVLALVGFFIFFAVASTLIAPIIPDRFRKLYLGACTGAVVGAHLANAFLYNGRYPSFHMATSAITLLLLIISIAMARSLFQKNIDRHPKMSAALNAVPILLTVFLAVGGIGAVSEARPYYLSNTHTGQWAIVYAPRLYSDELDTENNHRKGPTIPPDPKGVEHFERYNNLPRLPEDFSLTNYNVLLITSEATRQDQTSMADPKLKTTPNLKALCESDDFCFTRAYAPSSGTLHSLASVHTMTYPSAVHYESWKKSWHGLLHKDNVTVAETFKASGYDTFWVSHSYNKCFGKSIVGMGQGFKRKKLFKLKRKPGNADEKIASAAIDALKSAKERNKPFFGWVFLVSPHASYKKRYDDMPHGSNKEKYRHDIRYMDEQLGRIFKALKDNGQWENTVVIYTGDHGEEFREHGKIRHKTTVYAESVQVPLIIHIPTIKGTTQTAPVSSYYVLPWLFLYGSDKMKTAAKTRINSEIAHMMRATNGAVVVELIGYDNMKSALVYDQFKINYDFKSKMYELFNIVDDPLEQNDLFETDVKKAVLFTKKVDEYRRIREATRRFEIYPSKTAVNKPKK